MTPEISFEIAKSLTVTWRAQPPFWIRFGALLKDAQVRGMPPMSVGGGDVADGAAVGIARDRNDLSRSDEAAGFVARFIR